MKYGFYILLLFVFSKPIFAQNSEKNLRITGDSMQGKVIDGENVREVIGNVVIIQDNVQITCNKAIQFLARNTAKLIGNVILTQDSVTIKTERGYYYRDIELTYADTNVLLDNGKSILVANKGKYNLNSKVAEFSGNVNFKDSTTDLESDSLVFYDIENKIIAIRNVVVRDSASMIYADTLIHNQNTHETFGRGNVKIFSEQNELKIFGQLLFDDKNNKMSRIEGNPYLIQIDKPENGDADTLMIKAKKLEAYKDSTNTLIAKDSVQILRGEFSSVNDYTIYDREKDNISIFRNELNAQPILWYENSQVTGDSILFSFMKI